MYDLEYSGQFKKDLKLMVKRGLDIEEMRTVLNFLASDGQVPESYKPHVLSGKFKGHLGMSYQSRLVAYV